MYESPSPIVIREMNDRTQSNSLRDHQSAAAAGDFNFFFLILAVVYEWC